MVDHTLRNLSVAAGADHAGILSRWWGGGYAARAVNKVKPMHVPVQVLTLLIFHLVSLRVR
ncbi:MAG UNVERIFIED_CONTAM: hypothetical protein LVT10_21165 [Anaerolineae bacterium]